MFLAKSFFFLIFYYFINAIISTLHIRSLYCCFHWYLAHSYILLYFDVFLHSWKSSLLVTKNVSPPTVFDLGGWNRHHFIGNWVAEIVTYQFFYIRSLSTKYMQHKKINMQKMRVFEEKKSFAFQMFIIHKFEKTVCEAVRLVIVNEIKGSNLFYL